MVQINDILVLKILGAYVILINILAKVLLFYK